MRLYAAKCKIPFTKDTVKEEIRADTAAKLGIAECLNQHPFDLSGGQAQKLAFGILLEQDADIFFWMNLQRHLMNFLNLK